MSRYSVLLAILLCPPPGPGGAADLPPLAPAVRDPDQSPKTLGEEGTPTAGGKDGGGPCARPGQGDDAGSDDKGDEYEGVPPEWLAVARRLKGIDRSDPTMPWLQLREFKNRYTICNPTPRALRREFVTDRPDKTVNPVTVDAGSFQVETDLVIATVDRRLPAGATGFRTLPTGAGGFEGAFPNTGDKKDDFKFLFTNLRIGLLNNTEVQIFARPFQYLRELPPDEPSTQVFGYGDMRTLLKHNLWGNEGGSTAACLTAFIDIPAGQRNLTTGVLEEGGAFAFLLRLPGKTYIGAELGAEARHDSNARRYHLEIPESLSVAGQFTKDLGGKVEFASVLTTEPGQSWFGLLALALLWSPGKDDIQFDAGINIGLTANAPDWQPYLGFAKRF